MSIFARRLAPSVAAAACIGALSSSIGDRSAVAQGNPEYSGGARGTPRLLIGNPDAFAKKWKKFSTDGIDKLLVIADFDQTLTPYYKPSGEQEASSHGALMTSEVLDPALCVRERELFARFFPICMSPTMSQEEKLPFMIDWWTGSNDLLIDYKLTRQQITEAVAQSDLGFRRG
ncbi:Had hydrolase, family ie, partial [Globisporangium polare]